METERLLRVPCMQRSSTDPISTLELRLQTIARSKPLVTRSQSTTWRVRLDPLLKAIPSLFSRNSFRMGKGTWLLTRYYRIELCYGDLSVLKSD